jgi:hypothetical protein
VLGQLIQAEGPVVAAVNEHLLPGRISGPQIL